MRSLVLPVDWEVDWQGPGFTARAPGDRQTVIDGGILYDCEHPMEIIADALYGTGAVVDNGPILRSAIGGLIWRQQASIVTRGEEKWQRLIACMKFEDRLIFVTLQDALRSIDERGTTNPASLTVRLGQRSLFCTVWYAVDVVPPSPRTANGSRLKGPLQANKSVDEIPAQDRRAARLSPPNRSGEPFRSAAIVRSGAVFATRSVSERQHDCFFILICMCTSSWQPTLFIATSKRSVVVRQKPRFGLPLSLLILS